MYSMPAYHTLCRQRNMGEILPRCSKTLNAMHQQLTGRRSSASSTADVFSEQHTSVTLRRQQITIIQSYNEIKQQCFSPTNKTHASGLPL